MQVMRMQEMKILATAMQVRENVKHDIASEDTRPWIIIRPIVINSIFQNAKWPYIGNKTMTL